MCTCVCGKNESIQQSNVLFEFEFEFSFCLESSLSDAMDHHCIVLQAMQEDVAL